MPLYLIGALIGALGAAALMLTSDPNTVATIQRGDTYGIGVAVGYIGAGAVMGFVPGLIASLIYQLFRRRPRPPA